MNILFYGLGLTGSSHLWMRRQFEHLKPYISVLVDYTKPDLEIPDSITFVELPGNKKTRSRVGSLFSDIKTDIQRRRVIKKLLQKHSFNIVVVHFLTNAVPYIKLWEKFSKPVYVHCHGIDVTWEKTGSSRKWRKLWWGDYVKEVQKLSVNVQFVANSDLTKRQLLKVGIEQNRIHVNNIGVPIPENLSERGKDKETVNILFIGRLVDVKGPTLLIKAFERACAKGFKGELTIAGDGPLYSRCKDMICSSKYRNSIYLLGAVSAEEGEELRLNADLFSAHSRKGPSTLQEEAYGVAFIEAMAAGLPVVTGKSGSLPEIVRHNVGGLLFEPGNIEEHAGCLLELWKNSDLRISMGRSARKRAIENYSLSSEMQGLEKIYGLAGK